MIKYQPKDLSCLYVSAESQRWTLSLTLSPTLQYAGGGNSYIGQNTAQNT